MRILITSGATREPIDSVRYISNVSTGKTGSQIAQTFSEMGAEVVFLTGLGSIRPSGQIEIVEFSSFQNLNQHLENLLRSRAFDAVIHAAAVSDFSFAEPSLGKISSDTEELHLKLTRNFKLVERLKDYCCHPDYTQIVAFKLTDTVSTQKRLEAVHRLSRHPKIDLVVHNDLSEITPDGRHDFSIYARDAILASGSSKAEMAQILFKLVKERSKS